MNPFAPLIIQSDALQATILPRGAALVGLRFAGEARNMVLGFADPAEHANAMAYAGALVGPIANRVRGGLVRLEGQDYQMSLNEAGRTCLHSGPDGLHAQDWAVSDQTVDAIALTCTLSPGICGLPGTRKVIAHYELQGPTLRLTIEATTDHPTPMNIASHPYWNLDGRSDVSGHRLQIEATTFLPVDEANLPTGAQAKVAGTLYDFQTPANVPLDPRLDVNFCLAKEMRNAPVHAARLTGSDGTALDIATTAPGLQVYNGAHLSSESPPTADFPAPAPYAAIALEPQHWPDAPHHAHFPQITLAPGDTYRQVTEYALSRP